jgi:hypothetical protein
MPMIWRRRAFWHPVILAVSLALIVRLNQPLHWTFRLLTGVLQHLHARLRSVGRSNPLLAINNFNAGGSIKPTG